LSKLSKLTAIELSPVDNEFELGLTQVAQLSIAQLLRKLLWKLLLPEQLPRVFLYLFDQLLQIFPHLFVMD
jgi:hypothetical protein